MSVTSMHLAATAAALVLAASASAQEADCVPLFSETPSPMAETEPAACVPIEPRPAVCAWIYSQIGEHLDSAASAPGALIQHTNAASIGGPEWDRRFRHRLTTVLLEMGFHPRDHGAADVIFAGVVSLPGQIRQQTGHEALPYPDERAFATARHADGGPRAEPMPAWGRLLAACDEQGRHSPVFSLARRAAPMDTGRAALPASEAGSDHLNCVADIRLLGELRDDLRPALGPAAQTGLRQYAQTASLSPQEAFGAVNAASQARRGASDADLIALVRACGPAYGLDPAALPQR